MVSYLFVKASWSLNRNILMQDKKAKTDSVQTTDECI